MAESSRKSSFYRTAFAIIFMALCVSSAWPTLAPSPLTARKRPSNGYMGLRFMCKVHRRNCRGGIVFKRFSNMMDSEKAVEDTLRQQQQRQEEEVPPFSDFLHARRQDLLRSDDNDNDNDMSHSVARTEYLRLLGGPLRAALLELLRQKENMSGPQR